MLIGLDPVLTPDLLHALASMGHGERIVLVDANYPATRGRRLIRLAGVDVVHALRAVLSVLPADNFVPDPAAVMQVVDAPDGVLAVLRVQGNEQVLCVINLGGSAVVFEHQSLKGAKPLEGSHLATLAEGLALAAYGRAFLALG